MVRNVSVSSGAKKLEQALKEIHKAAVTHAKIGLFHATVKFEGEWYADPGNQDILRNRLMEEDITVMRIKRMKSKGEPIVRFEFYWGDDVEKPQEKVEKKNFIFFPL